MWDLDDEIHTVEAQIARERDGIAALLEDCGETARDAVTSPKTLLGVAALGFVLGEALRANRSNGPSPRHSVGTLLAGTALALMRASPVSPWRLAQRLWSDVRPQPARAARPASGDIRPKTRSSSGRGAPQGR